MQSFRGCENVSQRCHMIRDRISVRTITNARTNAMILANFFCMGNPSNHKIVRLYCETAGSAREKPGEKVPFCSFVSHTVAYADLGEDIAGLGWHGLDLPAKACHQGP